MNADRPMRGLGRQGILNATATFLPGFYAVAATGLILQTVGAGGFGPWAMAVVLLGWLSLLDLGLAQTVVRSSARAVAGDTDAIADVLAAGSLYAGLGVVGLLAGTVFAFLIPGILGLSGTDADESVLVAVILATDAAIVLATASWSGVLRGTARFESLFTSSVAQVATATPLLLVLLPALGLPGAAAAQVGGRIIGRVVMVILLRRQVRWFRPFPHRPPRRRLLGVFGFSAPIFLIQLGTQLGSGTDVLIVGITSGSVAAGSYAAGAQLVRYAAYFVFPVLDVVFPRLATLEVSSPGRVPAVLLRSLMLGGVVGTVVFGTLALEASEILHLWAGDAAALSIAVLILYSCAYVVITPVHLLVLALIARGRHRTVAVVIVSEAVINLALSVALANAIGPVGPAISTVIVVAVDDILVIPVLAARRLALPLVALVTPALAGVAIGIGALLVAQLFPGATVGAMVVRAILAGGLLALLVAIGLRWPLGQTRLPGDPSIAP